MSIHIPFFAFGTEFKARIKMKFFAEIEIDTGTESRFEISIEIKNGIGLGIYTESKTGINV